MADPEPTDTTNDDEPTCECGEAEVECFDCHTEFCLQCSDDGKCPVCGDNYYDAVDAGDG